MSALVQKTYTDEELCESSHYQRSMRYFYSLFGPTYYCNRPLIASQRLIQGAYRQKRSAKKKSVKEKLEDSLINLNVFQMRYDTLKFLSNKCKPFTNPLHEWLAKRKRMKEMKKAGLESETELPDTPEESNQDRDYSEYSYYPVGMKDFHTLPVFHTAKSRNGTHKKSLETTLKPVGSNESQTCKFCPKSTIGLLDPEAWYESYTNTVTYPRIPKEHKKKIRDKFRTLNAACSSITGSSQAETTWKEIVEASSFAQFAKSAIQSRSSTGKAMSGQGSRALDKLYGPDAIALVSGPEFRRRGREVNRSLPNRNMSSSSFIRTGKSASVLNISNSNPARTENAKFICGLNIPIPASRFRFLDDEFKLSDIQDTPTPPGTPVPERRIMTPVTGSRSVSCIAEDIALANRSVIIDQSCKDANLQEHQRARGMASVPHIPGAYGDVFALAKNQSLSSIQPLKATHEFIVGAGTVPRPKPNPILRKDGKLKDGFIAAGPSRPVVNKEHTQAGRISSLQLSKESMAKLSAIKPKNANPDEATFIASTTGGIKDTSQNVRQVSRKPPSFINSTKSTNVKRKPQAPKHFKQIISTVTLNPPRSKTKPVGLLTE